MYPQPLLQWVALLWHTFRIHSGDVSFQASVILKNLCIPRNIKIWVYFELLAVGVSSRGCCRLWPCGGQWNDRWAWRKSFTGGSINVDFKNHKNQHQLSISISVSISFHRQLSLILGGVEVGCHSRGGELRHWSDMLATPRFVFLTVRNRIFLRLCFVFMIYMLATPRLGCLYWSEGLEWFVFCFCVSVCVLSVCVGLCFVSVLGFIIIFSYFIIFFICCNPREGAKVCDYWTVIIYQSLQS